MSIISPPLEKSVAQKYWPYAEPEDLDSQLSEADLYSNFIDQHEEERERTNAIMKGKNSQNSAQNSFSSSPSSSDHHRTNIRFHDSKSHTSTPYDTNSSKNGALNPLQGNSHSTRPHPEYSSSNSPLVILNRNDGVHSPQFVATRPHTAHLTDNSIYKRQSIIDAESPEHFRHECDVYKKAPNFDPFVLEASCLAYYERLDAKLHDSPHSQRIFDLLTQNLKDIIRIHREKRESLPSFNGEKLDLAIILIPSSLIIDALSTLDLVTEFLDLGGKFDPPVLPSTWRRIWTSTAHVVNSAGYINSPPRLCEIALALFNHIYLHQLEMTGHARKRGPISISANAIYLPNPRSVSLADNKPRSKRSILNLELTQIYIDEAEAPLLRSPQTVSSILAILSQVGGHLPLKREMVHLYTTLIAEDKGAFPPRRIITLSGLLFSWGETAAARAGLSHLSTIHASRNDPKSALIEHAALQYLMICNNAEYLLEFAQSMTIIPGHIPSPLSLPFIIWAVKTTSEYHRLLLWWRSAAAIWRNIPTNQNQQARGHSIQLLVRPPLESTTTFLELAAEHFNSTDLVDLVKDITEIFGVRPLGSKSLIIHKLAREGQFEEAIRRFGPHSNATTITTTTSANTNKSKTSKLSSNNPSPNPTGGNMNLVTSKVFHCLIDHGDGAFEKYIVPLMNASIASSEGTFCLGLLIEYVCTNITEPRNPDEARKWIPFLNWLAALPMADGTSPTSTTAEIVPNDLSVQVTALLDQSRQQWSRWDKKTIVDQMKMNARTCTRLADLAGMAGLPNVVTNIISRVNWQFQRENEGETMPFSVIWIRPVVQAHALSGHIDTVFNLLASLKQSLSPSDKQSIWKMAFKSYIQAKDNEAAMQLFLSIKNKTVDDSIPTWSGGYTMGIKSYLEKLEYEHALQVYSLMIGDGFELRDRSAVLLLIDHLRSISSASTTVGANASNVDITSSEHHQQLLRRLELLEPTLDDSKPIRRRDPARYAKKRAAQQRNRSERFFIANLDRNMSTYKPRDRHTSL
jgi:hypothetical protein